MTHIDEKGRFQSDKYPELGPDKIVLSFKDPLAHVALSVLAVAYAHADPDLGRDIMERLQALKRNKEFHP